MRIRMSDRTEQYTGAVEIDFEPNENVTVRLTDGRIVDLFADGTWQVWHTPLTAAQPGQPPAGPELLGQGAFHPADPAPATD